MPESLAELHRNHWQGLRRIIQRFIKNTFGQLGAQQLASNIAKIFCNGVSG